MIKSKAFFGIVFLTSAALLLSACSTSSAETDPDLVGWISDIQRAEGSENPGHLLISSPHNKTSDKFMVTVTDKTVIAVKVGEKETQASFDVLDIGHQVEVWFSGPVMESYPAQVVTNKVVIVDTSKSGAATGIGVSFDDFLSQKHITKEIEITYPGLLTVTLCSNPTTGFRWSEDAGISDETVLKQYKHDFIEPETTEVVGAAGSDVWEFRSLEIGTSTIHFEYSRPWEGGERGEWTLELIVTVK